MSDYISRDAAIEVLCDACGNAACPKGLIQRCSYYERMQTIPAADARPAVREKWIPIGEKLPNKSGLYLVWSQWPFEENPTYGIINYDEEIKAFGEWNEYFSSETLGFLGSEFKETQDIIAWMPLPDPFCSNCGVLVEGTTRKE